MAKSDVDYIRRERQEIGAMRYEFGGIRVYHSGNVDIGKIEKFYANAPYYVDWLLNRIEELERTVQNLNDNDENSEAYWQRIIEQRERQERWKKRGASDTNG